jgi:hypothetical protein
VSLAASLSVRKALHRRSVCCVELDLERRDYTIHRVKTQKHTGTSPLAMKPNVLAIYVELIDKNGTVCYTCSVPEGLDAEDDNTQGQSRRSAASAEACVSTRRRPPRTGSRQRERRDGQVHGHSQYATPAIKRVP